MTGLLGAVHEHADSVLALRIFFGVCLLIVLAAGLYVFRIRRRLFGQDRQFLGDSWASRNLRLWQVILVWVLAVDLLITMLLRL